jgi:hypothetical protein
LALASFPGCSQCKVVHEQRILFSAFSWAFCGIEDGADVYTIPEMSTGICPPPPPQPKTVEKAEFARAIAEVHGDGFDEQLCAQICEHCDGAQLARQLSRLKDKFFDRVEGSVKTHRRMLRNFFLAKQKESEEEEKDVKSKKRKK